MDPTRLMTHSLRSAAWGESAARVLAAALDAVDPAAAVATALQRHGDRLQIGERSYDLSRYRRVRVIGAGKAGVPMARAAAAILGQALTGGLVVVKEGHAAGGPLERVQVREAGHPLPDERSVRAAGEVQALLQDGQPDDLVICLISGGGSALLVSPAAGISLDDLQRLTGELLRCGASIEEINALRKHLDGVKGGGLARLAAPATVVTLILSDVVGDPLAVIASGPTVPDPTTFQEAWSVLERYAILDRAPQAVLAHLQRGRQGELPDTPKPGDSLFERVQNYVIGSNRQAAWAGLAQAEREGLHPLLLTTYLQGEARQVGRVLASIARQAAGGEAPLPRPCCIVAGGETTVTLLGDGRGGRNQELALATVHDLAGLVDVVLISLATDGGDGPTDAAGAVVTGESFQRAQQAGLDPHDHLAHNDAYPFFAALDDLLRPGPTQTNVNDLAFIFAF